MSLYEFIEFFMSYETKSLGYRKTLSILMCVYKMENNYETLRMPELKALGRERKLRGYSRLRKAELIAFLQDDKRNQPENRNWKFRSL